MYSFKFPKKSSPKDQSIKNFTTGSSFPVISTHVTPDEPEFVTVQVGSKSTVQKNTFRSRNSFIIARNILSKLLTDNNFNFKKVSKGVSMIWNVTDDSFKSYFEYLSILESNWYERKRTTSVSYKSLLNVQQDSYIQLCSSQYEIPIRKISHQGSTTRFRLYSTPNRITKKKTSTKKDFNVGRSIINCNYGIFTEDVFQE